jgi:hypothetical protein
MNVTLRHLRTAQRAMLRADIGLPFEAYDSQLCLSSATAPWSTWNWRWSAPGTGVKLSQMTSIAQLKVQLVLAHRAGDWELARKLESTQRITQTASALPLFAVCRYPNVTITKPALRCAGARQLLPVLRAGFA